MLTRNTSSINVTKLDNIIEYVWAELSSNVPVRYAQYQQAKVYVMHT